MADTSLIFSIIARDRTSAILNKLSNRTAAFGRVAAASLGPMIAPAAAAGAVGVISLGGAFVGAGAAAGVFGAVAKSAMTEVSEAATKVEDLNDKMRLYKTQAALAAKAGQDNEKYLKKQAEAALELKARLKNLPPETRNATMAFLQMKSDWGDFVDQNKPATFSIMASGYKLLGKAILQLQPFFDAGAGAARRLIANLTQWVNGGGIKRMADIAGPALDTLTGIIINVGRALGRMFGKVGAGQGQGVLEWIEEMTFRWSEWAGATEKGTGINKLIEYAQQHGPQVAETFGNIATAAMHIAQAVSPIAPVSIAIASALASVVAAVPSEWITTIVAGFLAYNIALRAFAVVSAIATAAQWAYNMAQLASPTTWIILAIIALVAVIVLIATKTTWFKDIWNAVWGFMKAVGAWFAGPFANFFVQVWNKIVAFAKGVWNAVKMYFGFWFGLYAKIGTGAANMVKTVVSKFTTFVNWIKGVPGRVGTALRNMFKPLWDGFRGFVNRIIGGWNNLSFGIPGFSFAGMSIPGINVGTPNIPYLDTGGRILRQGLAMLHRGEEVHKPAVVSRTGPGTGTGRGGGGATIRIEGSNTRVIRVLLELLREGIRDQGGDVVKVLTPR